MDVDARLAPDVGPLDLYIHIGGSHRLDTKKEARYAQHTMMQRVNTRQAAYMIGVNPQTIRRAVSAGALRASPFGSGPRSGWRIDLAELTAFAHRRAEEQARRHREGKTG